MKISLYGTLAVFLGFVIITAVQGQEAFILMPLLWATVLVTPWIFLYWFIRFVKQYIENSNQTNKE
ncbi:hypothetical protein [Salibacterium aidingense]|uniref:hypothetical protein n=1 Tax=Salibacterium aidingense TaxID=384933 RepID=UPI0004247058|nr:hypothetical protein [Salibacterium aidingense]